MNLLADVRPPPEFHSTLGWALLAIAFVALVLVIYWLTTPPARKVHQPRSRYTLPTSSSSEARRFERPTKNPPARIIKPETQIIGRLKKR